MNNRRRRYPPKLIEFVRRLGEQGYRTVEAEAAVRKLGTDPMPTRETIHRWLDPDYWEAHRMKQRKGSLPGPRPTHSHTWQRKLERLRELRSIGLTYKAVALVMNHDYGLILTEDSARAVCTERFPDDSLKEVMEGRVLRRGRRPVASKSDGRQHQRQARPALQAKP